MFINKKGIKNNLKSSQKVKMPVTDYNSTIKIAPLNKKLLQKTQFPKRKKGKSFREYYLFLAA